MDLCGKKILVTGAGGFIGSHLTEALVRAGAQVRAFNHYNSLSSWGWLEDTDPLVRSSVDIFMGDIRDPYGVKKAVKGCEMIFHLAALITIPYSYHSPDNYIDTNIKGTLNILQAARELEIQKIIHTSTSEVYGTAQFVPIDETHPLQAQSPYSATKIGADQMALSFFRSFNTPVSIVRPFNTYGPRQSTRAVIPAIITQMLDGQKSLKLGALHPTRDFNFVKDTVSGFIAAATSDRSNGEVFNIASNFEISIGETAELIFEIMGRRAEITCDQPRLRPRKSEVDRLWGSHDKAGRLLGWSPQYGGREGFRRGIKETVDWFSCDENRLRYKANIYNL